MVLKNRFVVTVVVAIIAAVGAVVAVLAPMGGRARDAPDPAKG